jgi:hypothetical protein
MRWEVQVEVEPIASWQMRTNKDQTTRIVDALFTHEAIRPFISFRFQLDAFIYDPIVLEPRVIRTRIRMLHVSCVHITLSNTATIAIDL